MANTSNDRSDSGGLRRELTVVPSSQLVLAQTGRETQGTEDTGASAIAGFLLHVFRRWWKVATPIGLVLAATIATYLYFSFVPMYRASAWIEMKPRPDPIVFYGVNVGASLQTQLALLRSPVIMGKVISKPKIAELPEIANEVSPVNWLTGKLSVKSQRGSDLYTMSLVGPNPINAADIVNAVVDVFLELRTRKISEQTQAVVQLLDQEQDRRALEVERLREKVRGLAKEAGASPFNPDGSPALPSPVWNLQSLLIQREFSHLLLDAEIKALEESFNATFGLGRKASLVPGKSAVVRLDGEDNDCKVTLAADGGGRQSVEIWLTSTSASGDEAIVDFDADKARLAIDIDPLATTAATVVAQLNNVPGSFEAALDDSYDVENDGTGLFCNSQLGIDAADVEAQLGKHPQVQSMAAVNSANLERLRDYKAKLLNADSDPHYQALKKQIRATEERLARLKDELRPIARKQVVVDYVGRLRVEIAGKYAELQQSQTEVEILKTQYGSALREVKEDTGDSLDLVFARSELSRADGVHNMIADRILRLETEQRALDPVELIEPAAPPKKPVEAYPFKKMAMFGMGCFLLPFGLAALWERVRRRVGDAKELAYQAKLPVVGEIARLPVHVRGSRSTSIQFDEDLKLFQESIDSLRTSLVLSETLQGTKVIAVTSASNNEGKTSVSVQLAVSLARATADVCLLVDADMRSPDVHRMLDLPGEPGLAELLEQKVDVDGTILTDWSKHVHVLPAGKLGASPHKLLGNGVFRSTLDAIGPRYRYVVIDTPPILAASEALVIAQASDASLLCTMRDVSRFEQVLGAQQRLVAAGANPVGVVLSGVPTRHYAYRYGRYQYRPR